MSIRPIEFPYKVLETVKEQFPGFTQSMLQAKIRKEEYIQPRHMFAALMNRYSNSTLRGIGLMMGGQDHSTVSNAIRRAEERIEIYRDYAEKYQRCCRQIEQCFKN